MNSTIWKRVKYYLVGLGMGLVLTFFIFGNRGCSWLPENRVKSQIEAGAIVRSDSMKCVLECNDISDDFIFDLVKKGEVNFSESKVKSEPKIYVLEYESVKIHFSIDEDSLSSIVGLNRDKNCDCSGSTKKPIKMTDKMIKLFLSNRDYQMDKKVDCIADCLGINNEHLFNLVDKGSASESIIKRKDNNNPTFDITVGDTILTIEHGVRKNRFISLKIPGIAECKCPD